ncbi:MAG: hypothetical protein WBX25_17360 [Rhodomicrobium sp.]
MSWKPIARMTSLLVCVFVSTGAEAQSWQFNSVHLAMKSGETVEVGDLYWVINCRSQLTSTPEVTIMDGPPGVTAAVEEAMVVPRFQQCSKPVKGGKLKLTAGTIDDQTNSLMTVRIRYKTRDGDRDRSMNFTIALFP